MRCIYGSKIVSRQSWIHSTGNNPFSSIFSHKTIRKSSHTDEIESAIWNWTLSVNYNVFPTGLNKMIKVRRHCDDEAKPISLEILLSVIVSQETSEIRVDDCWQMQSVPDWAESRGVHLNHFRTFLIKTWKGQAPEGALGILTPMGSIPECIGV
jgi:hypothetical protein